MPNWNTLTNKQGLIVWGGEQSTNYGIVSSLSTVFSTIIGVSPKS